MRFLLVGNDQLEFFDVSPTTVLDIDTDILRKNVSTIQDAAGQNVALIAVVKSDGYGMGQERMAQELISTGVHSIGVATTIDALRLRAVRPDATIMLIYPVLSQDFSALAKAGIEITVTTIEHVRALDAVAKENHTTIRVHLQVETGMHHYGADSESLVDIAQFIEESPYIIFAGISTHFASAGVNQDATVAQYDNFITALTILSQRHIYPEFIHCANSAAFDVFPESWTGDDFKRLMPDTTVAVRIGSLLYGLYQPRNDSLRTRIVVTQLTTHLVEIKQIKQGETVGYFGSFVAQRDMRIGILPLGWGSNGFFPIDGRVSINGIEAPIIGSIGANTCAVDISNMRDVMVGQLVSVLDTTGVDNSLGLEEVASRQSMFVSRFLLSVGTTSCRRYITKR